MSVVSKPEEGAHIKRHIKIFTGRTIDFNIFGRLKFELDITSMSIADAMELCDQLENINSEFEIYIERDNTIYFDYYVTPDLLPIIRGVIEEFAINKDAKLKFWIYS